MSTINFTVRNAGGAVNRGQTPDADSAVIRLGAGQQVSLNLAPSDIVSYTREGDSLVLELANGQTIALDGYFSSDRELYLSQSGEIYQVDLGMPIDEQYLATYDPVDTSGKWSSYDDLVYLDLDHIEPVVAPLIAPFLGGFGAAGAAAAAVGAAALLSNGDDDGEDTVTGDDGEDTVAGDDGEDTVAGDDGEDTVTGDDGEDTVTGDDGEDTVTGDDGEDIAPMVDDPEVDREVGGSGDSDVTITGTGETGSTVAVTVGDTTVTTTVDEGGNWEVVVEDVEDGVYDSSVVVVAPDGTVYELDGPSVDIDTTGPEITVTEGTLSTGEVVNAVEQADGHTIGGTGEAGATVSVEINGVTQTTTVSESGSWSVHFSTEVIITGEYETSINISATDSRGNSTVITETLSVDTVAPTSDLDAVEGDNIINSDEAADGLVLTGTGEVGATVTVEFMGSTQTTTVTSSGTWSVAIEASVIVAGTYESAVTVTATDLAGNSSVQNYTVQVDTDGSVSISTPIAGDGIINEAEASAGVTLTGEAEAGSSVAVTLEGVTHTVTATADGTWSTTFNSSEITAGTYEATVTVTATDLVGNSSTTTGIVQIDTEATVAIDDGQAGGDDIINAQEEAGGVTLTGTAEAGSVVSVTVEGVTETTVAGSDGTWEVTFSSSDIPEGEYETEVSVTSVDSAGNSTTTTSTVQIDTMTSVSMDAPIAGDGVVNEAEASAGVTLAGDAEAGATVEITLGTVTHTVTAGEDGGWTTTFSAAEIPAGSYEADVTVVATDLAGNTATTRTTVDIDTETSVGIDSALAGGDDIANAEEVEAGLTVTGTGEAGAAVEVSLDGVTKVTTVAEDGSWSVDYASDEIRTGEYDADVTATITDAAGNSQTTTSTLRVDTETSTTVESETGGDETVNTVELADGLVLSGTAEPGATIVVEIEGVTREVTAGPTGEWSVLFEKGSLPTGEYETTATVTATDAVGNVSVTTDTFMVDTYVANPIVESVTFADDNVSAITVETTGDAYEVSTLNGDGTSTELSPTTVELASDETLLAFNPAVADGSQLVVTATDDAQNQSDTLIILDDNATNAGTLDHASLGNFQLEAIELDYASDASLTLTADQIRELSDSSNSLTIHGGADDAVTVTGAVATGETRDIDGESYDVYTVGDDGVTLVIDQDINVII